MATGLTLQSQVHLRDGNEMPILGLGTYEMDGKEAYKAVTWALEAGYRHIDCAAWYYNEKEVGRAILDFCNRSEIPRSEIFYTSKLQSNEGYSATKKAIQKSLNECGLGYIDLYLVHSPYGGTQARMDSWKAILEDRKEGKLHSVGVSNYGVRHLKEMVELGAELPAVNQIDLHPFMTRKDIVELCEKHNIVLEAWAPLVRGLRFRHPVLVDIAQKHKKSVSQILLRYSLQKGFVPLPKSVSKDRILSNAQIFDFSLPLSEIQELDGLDEYLVTDWDPTNCS